MLAVPQRQDSLALGRSRNQIRSVGARRAEYCCPAKTLCLPCPKGNMLPDKFIPISGIEGTQNLVDLASVSKQNGQKAR
ncbi:MAG TPA: hypothetical protein DDW76_01270 [Cyanobacteria bacterium UBA11369]|nr:hypothetical protein [Cyanobacteria bacterium UBA11371]HBE35077.1 hypothetical protein [Cyanobacteria bacterium UBA11368]HBE47463.1 hypothetical protein [Cyanobacteria bacterium UBA11369]